jgi:hypothetical protein
VEDAGTTTEPPHRLSIALEQPNSSAHVSAAALSVSSDPSDARLNDNVFWHHGSVIDDEDIDTRFGGTGRDWFFLAEAEDVMIQRVLNERIN